MSCPVKLPKKWAYALKTSKEIKNNVKNILKGFCLQKISSMKKQGKNQKTY